MIPAILSCVFVIYLYHKLNSVPQTPSPTVASANSECDTMESLIKRLDGMRTRLDALRANDQKEGGK